MINIAEILIANGTGCMLLLMLFLLRPGFHKTYAKADTLFYTLLFVTFAACVCETTSFLIDGKDFALCKALQYLSNFVCIGATAVVGYLWCLYADMRMQRSDRHLKRVAVVMGIPLAIILAMLVADLFGAGLIFRISAENVYARTASHWTVYAFLFSCHGYSIVSAYSCWKKGPHIRFFPVLVFVLPCMIGTLIQGLRYGISVGWMMVAVGSVFVQLNLQREYAFMDTLSGLYNRNYFIFLLDSLKHKQYGNVYGIMLDINGFKGINDTFGHVAGDDAIQTVASVLRSAAPENAITLRMGGDEFVVLLVQSPQEEKDAAMVRIQEGIRTVNEEGAKPYSLSLAMGAACYSGGDTEAFLSDMDKQMYLSKEEYYRAKVYDPYPM